jgi:hypothetical protein
VFGGGDHPQRSAKRPETSVALASAPALRHQLGMANLDGADIQVLGYVIVVLRHPLKLLSRIGMVD